MADYKYSQEESKTIEVNPFKLYYVGFFVLEFDFGNKFYSQIIYLEPSALFKIIENEGLKDSFQTLDFHFDGVEFSKTTLLLEGLENEKGKFNFLTSELAVKHDSSFYTIDCEIKSDE